MSGKLRYPTALGPGDTGYRNFCCMWLHELSVVYRVCSAEDRQLQRGAVFNPYKVTSPSVTSWTGWQLCITALNDELCHDLWRVPHAFSDTLTLQFFTVSCYGQRFCWKEIISFQAVAYPGILFGGGSTNSVEDRENGDLGAVTP
jgi:hypothetical protein